MSYTLISMRELKARKEYRCIWCSQTINIGEVYKRERSVFDGEPSCNKWHPECLEACHISMAENHEDEFTPYENQRPRKPGKPSVITFDVDDRGNVVDIYRVVDGDESEQVARLDREATVNGVADQLEWDNWGGEEVERWAETSHYAEEIKGAHGWMVKV